MAWSAIEVQRMHLDRVAVGGAAEVLRAVGEVDEGVESLIHPGVEPLVDSHDHRRPLVADLVRHHPLQFLPARARGIEGQHGVFHSLDRALDARHLRVGIAHPLLAEVLHRLAGHPVRLGPARRRRAIEGVDHDAVVAAGIPPEVGCRGKREVADGVGAEAPYLGADRLRPGGVGAHLIADDRDRRVAGPSRAPGARAAPVSARRRGSSACRWRPRRSRMAR